MWLEWPLFMITNHLESHTEIHSEIQTPFVIRTDNHISNAFQFKVPVCACKRGKGLISFSLHTDLNHSLDALDMSSKSSICNTYRNNLR